MKKKLRVGDVFKNYEGREVVVAKIWKNFPYVDYEVFFKDTGERGSIRARGYLLNPEL